MKKTLRKLIIVLVVCSIAVGLLYDQLSPYSAYPKEALGISTVNLSFTGVDFSQKIEFASKTIKYQAQIVTLEGNAVESPPAFSWYIKQGANVIQEMPIDGISRQSNNGRIGKYTLSFGEIWSPLVPTLEKQGYTMSCVITYSATSWPEWPKEAFSNNRENDWIDWPAPKQEGPSITDAALEKIGIYRIDNFS